MKEFFEKNGYFRKQMNPAELSTHAEKDINLLRQSFDHLPLDPYAAKVHNRARAYSNLVILPWDKKISWIPSQVHNGKWVSAYWQGGFNPEHRDATRYFTPLATEVKNSDLLQNLILHDFEMTYWDENSRNVPIYVGVHFVKLQVSRLNRKSISSPDCVHRDGEAFTFAHLFNRENVNGGVNYIADVECANQTIYDVPENRIKMKFEMTQPFDSYAVCDSRVSHYVSPVEIDNENKAEGIREIILIDFSPMQQQVM